MVMDIVSSRCTSSLLISSVMATSRLRRAGQSPAPRSRGQLSVPNVLQEPLRGQPATEALLAGALVREPAGGGELQTLITPRQVHSDLFVGDPAGNVPAG